MPHLVPFMDAFQTCVVSGFPFSKRDMQSSIAPTKLENCFVLFEEKRLAKKFEQAIAGGTLGEALSCLTGSISISLFLPHESDW